MGADRAADREARRLLGRRGSSVFAAPPREVLDRAGSCDGEPDRPGPVRGRVSAQAWNLVAKMRDVDRWWQVDPARVVEVHPELSFRELAGGEPLPSKRTWAGLRRRVALLAEAGIVVPDEVGDAGRAGADDVLDTAAVAWSAARCAAGRASHVPRDEERDPGGRSVRISW